VATVVITGLYVITFVVLFALLTRRVFGRRGRWSPGAAAAGAIHDLLIEDKRKSIEIILEERAEYTDPETKDGDLPGLARPKATARSERTD
jgi:hypothetical protein